MALLDRVKIAWRVFAEPRVRTRSMPPSLPDSEFQSAMEVTGYNRAGPRVYTETEARAELESILRSNQSPAAKYEWLHALDVRVQNQTDLGMASPVISEILNAQYQMVKEME